MNAAGIKPAGDTLVVEGTLDFDTVVRLAPEGRRWLEATAPPQCRLDLAGVSYSNSAGVALLLEWCKSAAAAGKVLQVQNMPASMLSIIELAGLEDMFR